MAALDDHQLDDDSLAEIAEQLGFDLDKILGREDEDQEPTEGFYGSVGRQEKGKG